MYFPDSSASLADVVVNYTQGPGVALQYANPAEALGVPGGSVSTGFVSLGDEGILTLQFTDNFLTTSGDSSYDLWVFEVSGLDPTALAVSTDGADWIDVRTTPGDTAGIDIDTHIGSGIILNEQYSFVRVF